MSKNTLPDYETLHRLLIYEADTGRLFWRRRSPNMFTADGRSPSHKAANWNSRFAGGAAFSVLSPNGYLAGKLGPRRFYAHRIVWKMITGKDPEHIDHINGDRTDNRFANLRSVSKAENNRNRASRSKVRMGVYPSPTAGKWTASIWKEGERVHLGTFESVDAAVRARMKAERLLGFHENHGRRLTNACGAIAARE